MNGESCVIHLLVVVVIGGFLLRVDADVLRDILAAIFFAALIGLLCVAFVN